MQVLPIDELRLVIRHYLFLETTGNDIKKFRLFSDGTTGIVFSAGNQLIAGFNNTGTPQVLPGSFFYGQLSAFKEVYAQGKTDLLIVVLQPSGISRLTGIPASELCDKIIGLEFIFKTHVKPIQEKLLRQCGPQKKINLLNHFFLRLTTKENAANHILAEASIRFMVTNKGIVSTAQLEKFTGYSERHIERKFLASVGCTPKRFGNIIRLHHFLKLQKGRPSFENFTAIACEAGYADQSHLIKEFRKHTGITASQYLYSTNKLSVNFIQLPMAYS